MSEQKRPWTPKPIQRGLDAVLSMLAEPENRLEPTFEQGASTSALALIAYQLGRIADALERRSGDDPVVHGWWEINPPPSGEAAPSTQIVQSEKKDNSSTTELQEQKETLLKVVESASDACGWESSTDYGLGWHAAVKYIAAAIRGR